MLFKPCSDRIALESNYRDNMRQVSDALMQLSLLSTGTASSDWELMWRLTQRALDASREARAFLKQHIENHECGMPRETIS